MVEGKTQEKQQLDVEDSNLANYGGKDHRNAMKAAAETEVEYKGAGTSVGVEVWRVENRRTEDDKPNFGVKKWSKNQHGEFYDGDSYIVLNTFKAKDPETGKLTDRLAWDVHFWLGKDTSIDERTVAAYKTVELDDLLDDGPVQHRETMNNESKLFQSYFKGGMQYLKGGIESGFRVVKPEEYGNHLFQIRRLKATTKRFEVDCVASSMNHGDCFILDTGKLVMVWYGEEASPFEKAAAGTQAHSIVNGRNGKTKQVTYEDNKEFFWNALNGTEADVQGAESANKKPEPTMSRDEVKLFRISDSNGSVEYKEEDRADQKGYTYDQLDTNDCFLVDSGIEIFIWFGDGASKREKRHSWKLVDTYQKEYERPSYLPVTLVREGAAHAVLRACFIN